MANREQRIPAALRYQTLAATRTTGRTAYSSAPSKSRRTGGDQRAESRASPLPPGLEWPVAPTFAGVRTELFKIRNARDTVIGVGSRVAAQSDELGDSIEWVLHFPARGTFFASIPPESVDGSRRVGSLLAGTREFRTLQGRVTERWVANEDGLDEDAPDGRIELITRFVGEHADDDMSMMEDAL